jgi:hypothetical protein
MRELFETIRCNEEGGLEIDLTAHEIQLLTAFVRTDLSARRRSGHTMGIAVDPVGEPLLAKLEGAMKTLADGERKKQTEVSNVLYRASSSIAVWILLSNVRSATLDIEVEVSEYSWL